MPHWLRSGAILGVLLSTQIGGTAAAQTSASVAKVSATDADVRCVVVALALTSSPAAQHDPSLKGIATTVALYYLGRLDGRTPDLDLESRILKEAKGLTAETMQAEGKACGERLTDRGKSLTKIGQDLEALGKQQQQPADK